MDIENNQIGRRKTLIPILSTIGTAFVVTAVVSLLGASWPWLMLIVGITLIVIAVFLSVPNTVHYFSPIHIYKQLRRACIWWFRGPKWSISKPIISLDEITPSNINSMQTNFTTTVSLVIKNRDDYPLEGALYSLQVNIEQRLGRRKVRCLLRPNPSYQITIQPHQEETYPLVLFGVCNSQRSLDIEKHCDWGIQGIMVGLNGAGYKDLHRGLYFKPERKSHIGVI